LKGYNIALLCTEKNPLGCHRFSLVSRALSNKLAVNIDHILFNGELVNQHDLEKKMLHDFRLENDLFDDHITQLEKAYENVGNKISYHELENGYE
jgi:hypothetical protein